jgi:hypothetical protein
VHTWLAKAAWRMHGHFNNEEQIRALYWASQNCGRVLQPNEVERTVENINRRREGGFSTQHFKPWSSPVPEETNKVVTRGPWDLRSESPTKIDDRLAAHDWLPRLFAPGSLLCVSWEIVCYGAQALEPYIVRRWSTKQLESWTGKHKASCDEASLLVPNPASFTWHYTVDHRRSTKCNGMFSRSRLYLVVEFDLAEKSRDGREDTVWAPWIRRWKKHGISIRGACAALLWHLSQYAPLVLAVWSGGKSLHGWFNVRTMSEEDQRSLMDYTAALGGDPATWTKCQLVRLPQGVRGSNKARQTVEYFDPKYSAATFPVGK